jgi:hypothetical protein
VGEVPDAPFKKSWHELALKTMLRKATEEGLDAISWDTGEVQANRYDLSKQISKITAATRTNAITGLASYSVTVHPLDASPITFGVQRNGEIDNVDSDQFGR